MERLLLCLGGKMVNLDEEDRVRWLEIEGWQFLNKVPLQSLRAGFISFFPKEDNLELCVQQKISFFAWEASWGKVLTLD